MEMNKSIETQSLMSENEAVTAEQHYSLKWNDYAQKLVSAVQSLRENEDFVDITLACDGNQYVAHKVILASCSPYFRSILKANPCKHPIVLLKDVGATELEHLLEFMYNGEVNIAQENLAAFLKTAESLRIRGLAGNSDEQQTDSAVKETGVQHPKRSATQLRTDGQDQSPESMSPANKRRRVVQSDGLAPNCPDIQFKSEPYDDPSLDEQQTYSLDADSSSNGVNNSSNGLHSATSEMPISEFLQQTNNTVTSPYFDTLKASMDADDILKTGLEVLGYSSDPMLKQEPSMASVESNLEMFLRENAANSEVKRDADDGSDVEGADDSVLVGGVCGNYEDHFLMYNAGVDVKPRGRGRPKLSTSIDSSMEMLSNSYVDDTLKWKTLGSSPFRHMNKYQRSGERRKKLSTLEGEGVDLKCTFCNKVFANRGSMMRHKRDQHLEPHATVTCDICGKVCKNKNCLITHRSVNHGAKQRTWPATQPQLGAAELGGAT